MCRHSNHTYVRFSWTDDKLGHGCLFLSDGFSALVKDRSVFCGSLAEWIDECYLVFLPPFAPLRYPFFYCWINSILLIPSFGSAREPYVTDKACASC